MDFCYFIGIDIAKETLDWAVYTQQGLQLSSHTSNTLVGIKAALAEFKALPDWNPKQAVFCMEHTGIYNAHLLELLYELKLHFRFGWSLPYRSSRQAECSGAKLTR